MFAGVLRLIVFCMCTFCLFWCWHQKKWAGVVGLAVADIIVMLFSHLSGNAVVAIITAFVFAVIAWFCAIGATRLAKSKGSRFGIVWRSVVAVWFGISAVVGLWTAFVPSSQSSDSGSSSNAPTFSTHQVIGQRLKKSQVTNHDDMYYTSKDDSNLRYFTNDDDKVTGAKYMFGANHYPFSSVENKLSNVILHDDNLKYTTDKDSRDDFGPDGDSFNVYSPKLKKWYHVKMQRDDDNKISSFSIWPGQDSDADDY